jgi:streptogramin lyase
MRHSMGYRMGPTGATTPLTMAEDTRIGTEVAGYRIEELIGKGGMGAVYLAEHLRLGRRVALKLLATELADNEKFRDRFLRESKLAASIDHPNIVPVYDADEVDGVLFLAMRYVEGTDLRGLIVSEGRLDPIRTAAIGEQLGDALDVAHARGLVHRDVKPGNILVTPRKDATGRDHVYLSDFGLTKRALSVSGLTQTGQIVGTIDYVAPEQVKGDPVDSRADQYSMGCVLYQCLTGAVPFPRAMELAVLWAHVQEPAPSLTDAGFGNHVSAVIDKALAKDPKDRYETCGELASAFSEAVGVARRPGKVRPTRPQQKRRRLIAVGGLAVALAVAFLAGLFLFSGGSTFVPGVNTVARINANSGAFDQPLAVGASPNGIAFADGKGWVTSEDNQTVQRFDPDTGNVSSGTSTQGVPTGIAGGAEGVFITTGYSSSGSLGSQVFTVNTKTSNVDPACDVPSSTFGIAEGGGYLWLTVANTGDVWRLDPTGCDHETIHLGEGADPEVIAVGGDPLQIWVGDAVAPTIYGIDSATLEAQRFGVDGAPTGITWDAGSVWISVQQSDEVQRLDASTGQARDTISFAGAGCDGPKGIAVGSSGIWVGCYASRELVLIDPATDDVMGPPLEVRGSPDAVVADGHGSVWVSVHRP